MTCGHRPAVGGAVYCDGSKVTAIGSPGMLLGAALVAFGEGGTTCRVRLNGIAVAA
jgi:hypothetical protein